MHVPTLETVLAAHALQLGEDLVGYRNHAYRVLNLCIALQPWSAEALERLAVVAAYHDLGIWIDKTFDYLEPSVRAAVAHLRDVGKERWIPEISEMILQHHKLSSYAPPDRSLVELFRRADWIDVSRGLVTFGIPREHLRRLVEAWPIAGFHRRLVELELARLRTHPWSPLPMLRL
jgi:hypothetical protein